MRRWSDYEVDRLIEDLTRAAEEAIERAAAEAAQAASIAGLEREAAALREAAKQKAEAERVKQSATKNAVIAGLVCFAGGLALGATTSFLGGIK